MFFVYFVIITVMFIVVFFWGILVYAQTLLSLMLEGKHRDAEAILHSGLTPPAWGAKGGARFGRPGLSKWIALRKIRRIITYFQHTPLVENEEARALLVARLQRIRGRWQTMTWDNMYPYE